MNRRQYREYTFKLLFHANFYRRDELAEQVEQYLAECMYPEEGQLLLVPEEKEQLAERSAQITEKLSEIDGKLTAASEGWKLGRMNKVDLTILRLAVYELFFDEGVPPKVAVNEAVELAKKYGGDESPQFVNGILAKFMKDEG